MNHTAYAADLVHLIVCTGLDLLNKLYAAVSDALNCASDAAIYVCRMQPYLCRSALQLQKSQVLLQQ